MDKTSKADFPTEILTFLFSDLVESTVLWEKYPKSMQIALSLHDDILKNSILFHGGKIVKSTGDGILSVFASPKDALLAAIAAQKSMQSEAWHDTDPLMVRIGLHSGKAQYRQGDFYGSTVNRAARLMSIGHGGQILLSQATRELVKEDLPEGILLEDMGSHTLKGLSHPERVYQILIPGLLAEFPPLRSITDRLDNLPAQVTHFVSRDSELEALSDLLLNPNLFLVSIVAPGGMGKTRLALELGKRMLEQFQNGVFLVELAPISDIGNIIPAVAEALGYQFQQNGRSPKQQVLDYLEKKHMLLILDNFEHLMDGAEIVTDMLRSTSRLKILVTSKQRLYQPGETLFRLPGLQLPDLDTSEDASRFAAIELFQQTAQRARTDFIITHENLPRVVHICRLVQGMPLGILLAASWIAVLSTQEIITEIQQSLDILEAEGSELPERQRSIRAVFDYAWGMMNKTEQAVFVKLAVFWGGFTREAAQKVAGARLRQLGSLLSKALISRDADRGRYTIHELLRQYAEEKLHKTGQYRQTHQVHTRYYLNFLAAQASDLKGAGQLVILKRIQVDFKNIR